MFFGRGGKIMLTPTKKKYLFIIYELGMNGGKVRSVDIANALNIKKASVSSMLPALIDEDLIERHEEDGSVVFTKRGAVFASGLYVKYLTLFTFFREKLGSSEKSARHDAVICLCSLTDENTENMTNYILSDR
jgi:DtxR family Mn-dependent transcriptional regulator